MQDCTHLSRFALVSTVFPVQKRKKVHRLLYHSLCTNVEKALRFDRKTLRGCADKPEFRSYKILILQYRLVRPSSQDSSELP